MSAARKLVGPMEPLEVVTLVIDDNHFSSLRNFPVLKSLETFSANKNSFSDLRRTNRSGTIDTTGSESDAGVVD